MSRLLTRTRLRIVGLGDSTTAGTPGFLSPLEAPPDGSGNLESQYCYWMMKAHPEWTVQNRGINGQRTDEIQARFEHDVTEAKPDYVIILAGVNDIYQGVSLATIKSNLRALYEKAVSKGIKTVAASVLPYNTASDSEASAIRDLNDWIQEAAQKLGILFCDTNRAAADPKHQNRLSGSPDGHHPDVAGYKSMGETLAHTIATDIQLRNQDPGQRR